MGTKKIRTCDMCKKEVNPYSFGAITLYNEIRIGRGGMFKEYSSNSPHIRFKIKDAIGDFDGFEKYCYDKQKELSFCSLGCCGQFIDGAFKEMFDENLEAYKKRKFEIDNITFEEYKQKINQSWLKHLFNKIKPLDLYKQKIKKFNNLIQDIKDKKKDYEQMLSKTGINNKK